MSVSATYGLTHLAITVSDVNRTLRFYQHVFDMKVMYHKAGFLQMTTPGCHDILVFEEKKSHQIGQGGGIAHFGFRLREPSAIYRIIGKLEEAGANIISQGEFVPGSPYIFFHDPDGYEIEVWYELL